MIILGGDMTGKALVPIINDGGGNYHATLLENREVLQGEEQTAAFELAVKRRGYYPFRVDPDELAELSHDEARWHALFDEHMLSTVREWMELADERLAGTGIRCFVCPGNDDQLEVDEVILAGQDGRARRGPRARVRRLPDGLERLGQPHALGHLSRGGRAAARASASRRWSTRSPTRPSAPSSACTARPTAPGSTMRPS